MSLESIFEFVLKRFDDLGRRCLECLLPVTYFYVSAKFHIFFFTDCDFIYLFTSTVNTIFVSKNPFENVTKAAILKKM